ncbi:hypothetical protein V7083_22200, partial [Bacillus sp. JJ1764]
EDLKIELLQLNHVTELKDFNGNVEPIAGWQSTKFNEKYPITQLQFSNKGTDLEYKTIINTSISNGLKNYTFKNESEKDILTVTYKNNDKETIILNN